MLVATGVSWNRLQNVDLVGAIRFSWVIAYVLPFQLFSVIGLFDTFKVRNGIVSDLRAKVHFFISLFAPGDVGLSCALLAIGRARLLSTQDLLTLVGLQHTLHASHRHQRDLLV